MSDRVSELGAASAPNNGLGEVGLVCGICDGFSPAATPEAAFALSQNCPQCGALVTFARASASAAKSTPEARPREQRPRESRPADARPAKGAATQKGGVRVSAPPRPPAPSVTRAPVEAPRPEPVSPPAVAIPQAGASLSEEELMDQARNYVCRECSTHVPSGHKFCGRCGTPLPQEIVDLHVRFFGAMQAPGKARLILIRGDAGVDGLSYLLQGVEHVAGRQDAQILFPDDTWLSAKHANFMYRGDKLVVRDEGSANGIYLRVRQPMILEPGDQFVCGEQVFRVEMTPKDTSGPDPDMTYFYSSPKRPSPFRVVQVIRGGATGLVACARSNDLQVGREENDINFPEDLFMSAHHAKVSLGANGKFTLTDLGSKNGTFVRIQKEIELQHGDYLFLGRQLLRVEMTT